MGLQNLCILSVVLALIAHAYAGVIEAECVIGANSGHGDVAGTVYFRQIADDKDVLIWMNLTNVGVNASYHGFHVHDKGDLTNQCTDAAGHYNPEGMNHSAPDSAKRHVGDLGNIIAGEDKGVITYMTDSMVKLSGDNSVLGRAVVVHALRDDLGLGGNAGSLWTGNAGARQGCCLITKTYPPEAALDDDIVAECEILADSGISANKVTGTVTLTYPKAHGETSIKIELSGLSASSKHGFHIHTYGSLGNQCTDAGGHYNPDNLVHGAPDDIIRHVGDQGNIQSDADGKVDTTITDPLVRLSGDRSVMGRAMVVHQGQDDLGLGGHDDSLTTGHAGSRIGCCVIKEKKSSSTGGASSSLRMLSPGMLCVFLLTAFFAWL